MTPAANARGSAGQVSRLEFLLRQTITYRHTSNGQNPAANQRQLPRVTTLANDLADLSVHSVSWNQRRGAESLVLTILAQRATHLPH